MKSPCVLKVRKKLHCLRIFRIFSRLFGVRRSPCGLTPRTLPAIVAEAVGLRRGESAEWVKSRVLYGPFILWDAIDYIYNYIYYILYCHFLCHTLLN